MFCPFVQTSGKLCGMRKAIGQKLDKSGQKWTKPHFVQSLPSAFGQNFWPWTKGKKSIFVHLCNDKSPAHIDVFRFGQKDNCFLDKKNQSGYPKHKLDKGTRVNLLSKTIWRRK